MFLLNLIILPGSNPFCIKRFSLMLPFMEDNSLSLPLLATPPPLSSPASALTATVTGATTKGDAENGFFPSSSGIISRLFLVVFIGTISMWANHEASKGFKVTIINNAKHTPAGRRFHLFYASNDEATRVILNTSALVENILYPDNSKTKKPVRHVVLQLSSKNLTTKAIVETSNRKPFAYVISLCPSTLEEINFKFAVTSAIQRAMARIWLWDGESRAPSWLIDGMEEYMWLQAGFGNYDKAFGPEQFCFGLSELCSDNNNSSSGDHGNSAKPGRLCRDDKDPKIVAGILGHLEQKKKGYFQGLNQILRDRWDEQPCHG